MMNIGISAISALSKLTAIDISPKETSVMSLDERLRDAFSQASVDTQVEYGNIMAMSNNPEFLSEPGGLLELQTRLGEYKQQVEVISALTRKGVATAETLLRA